MLRFIVQVLVISSVFSAAQAAAEPLKIVAAENFYGDGRCGKPECLAGRQGFLLGPAGNQRKKEKARDHVLHFTLFQEYSSLGLEIHFESLADARGSVLAL